MASDNKCGCCGGECDKRHRKPTDPEFWGDNHWPTALPHEKAGWLSGGTNIPANVSEANESTSEVPLAPKKTAPSTVTGLVTLNDFIQETKNLGVFEPVLVNKIKGWFARADRGECGSGMCRMQCNNLLKSAVKNKPK